MNNLPIYQYGQGLIGYFGLVKRSEDLPGRPLTKLNSENSGHCWIIESPAIRKPHNYPWENT